MAARTGIGVGMGVTVAILGTLALGLFILTLVFMGDRSKAQADLLALKQDTNRIMRESERSNEGFRAWMTDAERNGKSIAGYMRDAVNETGSKVVGTRTETLDDLNKQVDTVLAANSGARSFRDVLNDRDSKIAQLQQQLADANKARDDAQAQLAEQSEITKRQKESYDKTLAGINATIKEQQDAVDKNHTQLDEALRHTQDLVTKAGADAKDQIVQRDAQISKLKDQYLIAQNKIQALQEQLGKNRLRPSDEAALVDGEILSLDPASTNVYINRGRHDHIYLGMTFSVYSDATAIHPDERTGDYRPGKATIEVIRVDDSSSLCRVTRALRGNPISRGDVIANPIYDPQKKYIFMVFGNFDADGDGVSTPGEANAIKALIESWGGKVTDSLAGDVDFLVLGERPPVPPAPGVGASTGAMQEYLRVKQLAEDYDKLNAQAAATSIPILNQNRLFTLIGR